MKPRAIAKLLLFNLALLLILLELTGLIAYGWRTGSLYYTHPPSGRQVAPTLDGVVEAYRIHPYLGFIIRPSALVARNDGAHRYNDLGFDTPYDYPLHRQPGELLVGITGGSAAAHLALFENRRHILAEALARHLGLADAADQVKVLNLAQGGFKQPQQLLIYQYLRSLGQELDLLITFDGFNEVALGARNVLAGVAADMPSFEHVRALREVTLMGDSSTGLETMLEARQAWDRYGRQYNRTWSGKAWETRFAAGFLVDYVLYKVYHRRYLQSRASAVDLDPASRHDSPSWFYLNGLRGNASTPTKNPGADPTADPDRDTLDTALDLSLAVWSRGSRQLARALAADGVAHLHVVQPNQYHATGRQFSDQESRVAISPLSPYRQLIAVGYPRLELAADTLRREGFPIDTPLTLLDDIPEPVYIDDCCHYTDTGQEALLEHIAKLAIEADFGNDWPRNAREN